MDFLTGEKLDGMSAEELPEALNRLYSTYFEARAEAERKQGAFARVLGSLMSQGGSGELNNMDMNFYNTVEAICIRLAELLPQFPSEQAEELALRAIRQILFPGEAAFASATLILGACDYFCHGLLPFLSREELSGLRGDYLKRTPKRKMFPKQLELLRKMK